MKKAISWLLVIDMTAALTTVDTSNLNTGRTEDMSYLFFR